MQSEGKSQGIEYATAYDDLTETTCNLTEFTMRPRRAYSVKVYHFLNAYTADHAKVEKQKHHCHHFKRKKAPPGTRLLVSPKHTGVGKLPGF